MRSKGQLGGFGEPHLAHRAHLPRAHVFTLEGARACHQGLACLSNQFSPVHFVSAEIPQGFWDGADLSSLFAVWMSTISSLFSDVHEPVEHGQIQKYREMLVSKKIPRDLCCGSLNGQGTDIRSEIPTSCVLS